MYKVRMHIILDDLDCKDIALYQGTYNEKADKYMSK